MNARAADYGNRDGSWYKRIYRRTDKRIYLWLQVCMLHVIAYFCTSRISLSLYLSLRHLHDMWLHVLTYMTHLNNEQTNETTWRPHEHLADLRVATRRALLSPADNIYIEIMCVYIYIYYVYIIIVIIVIIIIISLLILNMIISHIMIIVIIILAQARIRSDLGDFKIRHWFPQCYIYIYIYTYKRWTYKWR